jgi:hypothetical protein
LLSHSDSVVFRVPIGSDNARRIATGDSSTPQTRLQRDLAHSVQER